MAGNRTQFTAPQALARLKEGNARFIRGQAKFPTVQKEILASLAMGQHPYATLLGCSDSRVPPELIFDAGFGELFVIRVAGNVLGPTIKGTLQYAATQLHTPLFVVLGHEDCGAVEAAIAQKFHGAQHRKHIAALLGTIEPALEHLDGSLPHGALMYAGVEANVRRTVDLLMSTPESQQRAKEGHMMLVGAVFDIDTGEVRFLE